MPEGGPESDGGCLLRPKIAISRPLCNFGDGMENREYTAAEACERMDRLGSCRQPFLFVADYALRRCRIFPGPSVDARQVRFRFGTATNDTAEPALRTGEPLEWEPSPCTYETYAEAFGRVTEHLRRGDSYLVNLTCSTPVRCNRSLDELYERSEAKYKLLLDGRFLALSPEIFVRIAPDGTIASFPMKGTVDATLPEAERQILSDPKEAAEHATITDLIRNDLSRVAEEVSVVRYRYIDRVETHRGALLQVSSEISGRLPGDWRSRVGSILFELLPAGSVTGAPKRRTLEIIDEAENYDRGYYTGVAGWFDGERLDSGVLIRCLERTPDGLRFKSGGGITAKSDCAAEYREMIEKVYVPLR